MPSNARPASVLAFSLLLAAIFLLALLIPLRVVSARQHPQGAGFKANEALPATEALPAVVTTQQTNALGAVSYAPVDTTTLAVAIHSSPVAVRDSNQLDRGPRVFVVHGVVTNTGTVTATDLVMTLDYQEDPGTGWELALGEYPTRTQESLAPGAARHSYWFATYPAAIGLGHQYEVTAAAGNAAPVSTTDNVFGNPAPGQTVQTASFQDTGSNGQSTLSAEIVVGVAFTMTVDYDMGSTQEGVTLSPAGNLDFAAGTMELRAVSVRFHNDDNTQETIVHNQLYFPTLPLLPDASTPDFAEATYTFLTLRSGSSTICPYAGIDYGSTQKYDKLYCQGNRLIVITGTLTLDLVKEVSDLQVQEGEHLTYTLRYTNTGNLPVDYAWIWDDVDPALGTIITPSVSPAPDVLPADGSRVAWDLGTVPAAGQANNSGTLTFAILVDGPADVDLADGQAIANSAFFGINEGSPPASAALTATVTSTVQAPTLVASNSDGLTTVADDQLLTYTIGLRNEGSVAAVGLSAYDVLPAAVQLAGTPSPPPTGQAGQTLSWDTLGDLAPGEAMTVTVPVTVPAGTPSFTKLLNGFFFDYRNPAGHLYQTAGVTDTTTVLRPAAFVEGYVYDDADGDGVRDPGESGLSGVALSLPGAYTPTATTDSAGFYHFRVEADGSYLVTETDPVGFLSTTPNNVAVDVLLGETYAIDFGDVAAGGGVATIHGTVFDDANGNGVWDTGEGGIPGVTVTLEGTTTATTDAYGSYSFGAVVPGVHNVEQTDLPGYASTTPNLVAVAAVADESYTVNYGDTTADGLAALHGTVFDDTNGDGVWDTGESGIPGVTITLDGAQTTTTDAFGSYSFGLVATGLHTVEESDLPGFISTTPNRVAVIAATGESYTVNYGDTVEGGGVATIHGTVFDDADGDGTWDSDEAGIAGVTVSLNGTQTTTTDAFGSYSFGTVPPGQQTVAETDPPNYVSTTPNVVVVDALADQTYVVNYGDRGAGSGDALIHGAVFDDANENGVRDGAETGIAGVDVTLNGTVTVTTDAFGNYSFGAVTPGVYTVTESDPSGYNSTTPNVVAVDALADQTYIVDFGDSLPSGNTATIHGTVFDDVDGNGMWDGGELGIAGVTVTLNGSTTTTTDAYGRYSFGGVAPGPYSIAETDPSGYVSTTPNVVVVDALADQTYVVNYGDQVAGNGTAIIHGTVFEDDDGDGIWDTDEAGIAGVTVTLDGTQTTTTDAFGSYSFGVVAPGLHTVVQTDLSGYISTTPNVVVVDAGAGEVHVVNYGDMPEGGGLGTIHGTVFFDDNGDGVWDVDEAGIPGITVTLNSTQVTTTNAYGSYSFGAVSPGEYTVTETDLPDYTSTTPNVVTVTVTAEMGYTVNFGDVLLGTGACPPDDYEDDDTAAAATPLAVGAVANHDFCDDDSGDWHTFDVNGGDVYTITTAALGMRADTYLALFDTDGQTLLAANDDYPGATDFSSQIVWHAPASGTYYMRITNRAGLSEWLTRYDVWVEQGQVEEDKNLYLPLVTMNANTPSLAPIHWSPPAKLGGALALNESPATPVGVIDHCNPDGFEVDDTWEQARLALAGVAQDHTFDSNTDQYAADKDFVFFDVGASGMLVVTSNPTNTSTLLELYDANGQALNRSGIDQLTWLDAPVGRYYLSVTPLSGDYSCDGSVGYELTVDYPVSPPSFNLFLPVLMKP